MDKKENPSSVWQGVVLEESLEDKSLLDMAKIVGTNVSELEKENRVFTQVGSALDLHIIGFNYGQAQLNRSKQILF